MLREVGLVFLLQGESSPSADGGVYLGCDLVQLGADPGFPALLKGSEG